MLIENPDVFKSWLTSILEPLCDADPAALAKYVYALVKKDKPLTELREGMVDQLDVFLQHETKPFVEMLFKSLETNEYLKSDVAATPQTAATLQVPAATLQVPAATPVTPATSVTPVTSAAVTPATIAGDLPPPPPPPPIVNNHAHATNGVAPTIERVRKSPMRQRVVVRLNNNNNTNNKLPLRPPNEQTLVKVLPLNELLEEPIDQVPRRRDRRGDSLRDKEDRRRRRSRSWERRANRTRRHANHVDIERRRVPSRSPSPRGRYRNRSPPPADRLASRSRSRSPAILRDREVERERDRLRVVPRELERDRMSRDREHRDRLSRSRDRDRSGERSRSGSRGENVAPPYRRRCRDYDEKGFCLRGDLCEWDHGSDPVVLEDATLARVVDPPTTHHAQPPEYNPLTPDIWCGGYPPYPPPHLPRELVPIPRMRGGVLPPPPPPPASTRPQRYHHNNFDYNRHKGPRPPLSHATNCSLQVKKVPRGLNDITHLNSHFGKFGKIVNIQVCFENDPEAALITFSSPMEANIAYKSTEAVLNNRFIKVFWHNPENKQENQAPGAVNNKLGDRQKVNQFSQNRVLINSNNMKMSLANNNEKKESEATKPTTTPSNPPTPAVPNNPSAPGVPSNPCAPGVPDKGRRVVEMYSRARALLETQLQQQVLLIQRLEAGNDSDPQKAALMEAINSAQEGIEKLRKELVAYTKMLKQMNTVKKPKTREEAQKEILDAELDLFTKQQEGQDVSELLRKIADMRRAMSIQFPSHPGIRPHTRFNPATKYIRGQAKSSVNTSVHHAVDHRPRALLVSGFEPEELHTLTAHLAQFGEICSKDVNLSVPELVVQFKARGMAEQALLRGKHYNDRTLSITWALSPKLAGSNTNNENNDSKDQHESQQEPLDEAVLRFDEEEEDDADEDRSWRR